MSYVNDAKQAVNVGDRVVYGGWGGHIYIGKVVSFTDKGNPRIELENRQVDMVRNKYRKNQVQLKHSTANIWDRRPGAFYVHVATGKLLTRKEFYAIPYAERWERGAYEQDWKGVLAEEWEEFTVPAVFTPVKKGRVFVIEAAK